jgi:prevent-host-death family protein
LTALRIDNATDPARIGDTLINLLIKIREESMTRTVSATEARIHFGELMNEVMEHKQPILVEKNGKRQVVLLAIEEYQRLQKKDEPTSDILAQIEHSRALVAADLQDRSLPHPADIIRQAQEERSEHFLNLLRR